MRLLTRARGASAAIAAASILAAGDACAQGIPLDRFDPAWAGDRMFGVPSPFVAGHLLPHVAIVADYAHDPLVLRTTAGSDVVAVVQSQVLMHLNVTLPLWNRVGLNVDLPVAVFQSGQAIPANAPSLPAPGDPSVGNLRLGLRARLFGEYHDAFQLGLGGSIWLPTGPTNAYTGNGQTRGLAQVLLGGRTDRLVWSAAAGPQFRGAQNYLDVTEGTEIDFGAGVGFLLGEQRRFQIGPEAYAAMTVANNNASTANSIKRATNIEILGDARWRIEDNVEAAIGLGSGLGTGVGTPDFRGVFSFAYTPDQRKPSDRDGDGILDEDDACPDAKGPRTDDPKTNGCPPDRDGDGIADADDACPDVKGVKTDDPRTNGCPPDRDGDGILDVVDACPDVKGVQTNDPRTNGCPPDRDGDGIADADDACPDVKGVKTNDRKTNGCPPDTDGDGILDADDACPDVKGVPTDDPKTNGCPLDTDKDGIPDDVDACPNEPGPANPNPKKNGCPRVHVTASEIVILEQVQFGTGQATILKESDALLDQVAAVFKDHTEIATVEVQGHTDNQGSVRLNKGLSQRRAEAVVIALVRRGIARGRLDGKGYGSEQPLADNATDAGRAENRRVQFKILKMKAKSDGKPPIEVRHIEVRHKAKAEPKPKKTEGKK